MSYAIQYAPWRDTYVVNNYPHNNIPKECVFCRIHKPDDNSGNYILYRGTHNYVALNKNPYNDKGHHLLIIPYVHEKHYTQLSDETREELDLITQKMCAAFSDHAHEIQINFNVGTYALASIPNHIHQHIIINTSERLYNLIDAMAQVDIPVDNEQQYHQLLPLFAQQPLTAYSNEAPATHDDNCYYCAIIQHIRNQHSITLDEFDQKNLIIHKGKHALILFSHYPFCPGNILIMPYAHYTSRNNMPHEIAAEMRALLTQLYPHLLSLFNADDISMGMISYGAHATDKRHICYEIMPRPGITAVSPITHTQYIHTNVMNNYHQLVELFKTQ